MKIFFFNINYFHQFFGFFDISLLQHVTDVFFTLNLTFKKYGLTIVQSYINISLNSLPAVGCI